MGIANAFPTLQYRNAGVQGIPAFLFAVSFFRAPAYYFTISAVFFMKILCAPASRPMLLYLTVLTFAQAAAFQGWNALYTNFAVEMAHFTGEQNGIVQSVREIPGLLSVGVILLLCLMREVTLTSFCIVLCGVGVICTGWFPTLEGQLFWTLLLSFG
ncbi:MAG: hypothetical protein LBV80_00500, partial [Deltaproteobacteria bacterium]|nr:hypothetical protein [Deltaproteobacteria bacterium]